MFIRTVIERDALNILEIYNYYILKTIITFETSPVSLEEMQKRIREKLTKHDWLVGEVGGKIAGYAYYGTFRERAAYNKTVEATIYLDIEERGKGYGWQIYSRLIQSASENGFREMIGVIALPNPESINLHAKLGFGESGVLKNVGYKFGKYLDIGFWQRSLV
jgi:phosphinothricin acetyltransferase